MTTFEEAVYQLNILLPDNDIILLDYYNNLSSHHSGDSGIDLFNTATEEIEPFQVGTVNFNIKCEMIDIKTNEPYFPEQHPLFESYFRDFNKTHLSITEPVHNNYNYNNHDDNDDDDEDYNDERYYP